MAGSLSNCLDDLNRPCTIVLDDYHSLRNDSAVHRWLEAFLKHPPVVRDRSSQRSSRRISKQGNARIRRALFMPALVAIQRDANVSAYYEKRLKSGIAKLQAITAVMRKLLHALWGMLHLRQEWNGEKFYRLSEPKTT
jgi:ATP/maltotriose-dependent transcriptional regulator MalT